VGKKLKRIMDFEREIERKSKRVNRWDLDNVVENYESKN
jgi:hypothetical protein